MASKPKIGAPTFEVPEITREGKSSIAEDLLAEMRDVLESGEQEWVSDNVTYETESDANKVRGAYRRGIRKLMGLQAGSKKFRVRTVGTDEDGYHFVIGLRSDEEAARLEQRAAERRAAKNAEPEEDGGDS